MHIYKIERVCRTKKEKSVYLLEKDSHMIVQVSINGYHWC